MYPRQLPPLYFLKQCSANVCLNCLGKRSSWNVTNGDVFEHDNYAEKKILTKILQSFDIPLHVF